MPKRAHSVVSATSPDDDSSYGDFTSSVFSTLPGTKIKRQRKVDKVSSDAAASLKTETKDGRREGRKQRNRISAQLSRDRKKSEKDDMQARLSVAEERADSLQRENSLLTERLERSSHMEEQLDELRKRFEKLEKLLLLGQNHNQNHDQNASQTKELSQEELELELETTMPSNDADVWTSGIGSETHATGMHSLFRSTTMPIPFAPIRRHLAPNFLSLSSKLQPFATTHRSISSQKAMKLVPQAVSPDEIVKTSLPLLSKNRSFYVILPQTNPSVSDKSKSKSKRKAIPP